LKILVRNNEQSKYYLIDSIYRHYSEENPKFVLDFILKNMNNRENYDKNLAVIKMITNCILISNISVSESCQIIEPIVPGLRSTIKMLVIPKIYTKNKNDESIKLDILEALVQAIIEDQHRYGHYDNLKKIINDILENNPRYLLELDTNHITYLINLKYIDPQLLESIYNKNETENGKIIIDILDHSYAYLIKTIYLLRQILNDHPEYSLKLNKNILDGLRNYDDELIKLIKKNIEESVLGYDNADEAYKKLEELQEKGIIDSDEYLKIFQEIANKDNQTTLAVQTQEEPSSAVQTQEDSYLAGQAQEEPSSAVQTQEETSSLAGQTQEDSYLL